MKYTKGKWEKSGSIILVYGEEGGIICQMAGYRPKSGQVEFHPIEINDPYWDIQVANANLIIAAPKLAETGSLLLRTVWDTLRHTQLTDGTREALDAAAREFALVLAKAEGGEK